MWGTFNTAPNCSINSFRQRQAAAEWDSWGFFEIPWKSLWCALGMTDATLSSCFFASDTSDAEMTPLINVQPWSANSGVLPLRIISANTPLANPGGASPSGLGTSAASRKEA